MIDNRFDNRIRSEECVMAYDFYMPAQISPKFYHGSIKHVRDHMGDLLSGLDRESGVFRNVVIVRSILSYGPSDKNGIHSVSMRVFKGPITPNKFIDMIFYPNQLSELAWHSHMDSFKISVALDVVPGDEHYRSLMASAAVEPVLPSYEDLYPVDGSMGMIKKD